MAVIKRLLIFAFSLVLVFTLSLGNYSQANTSTKPLEALQVAQAKESSMSTSVEQNKSIALRYAKDGFGDLALWDEVVAPDFVSHFCNQETIHGVKMAKEFEASLFQGFPKLQRTVEDVIAEGDKVAIRSTLRGAHTGNFMGILPTGKPVDVSDLTLLRIADGKIVEEWYELNLLAVMKQLGVIPSAG